MNRLILAITFTMLTVPAFAGDMAKEGKVYKCTVGEQNDEVTVGDAADQEFPSKIKMTKWNKEAELSLRYDAVKGTDSVKNGKVEIKKAGKKHKTNIYKKNANELEFEIIEDELTESNTIYFQIENWQDYDFLYQDTLENDWARDSEGMTLAQYLATHERPENVIDSYAVYHKTLKDGNYMTGKFCHIYRVKIIDDYLNETWAERFTIREGTGSIIIPEAWYKTAHRPIRIDPTMGYTSLGASNTGTTGDTAQGVYCGRPASAGNATKIFMGLKSNGSATQVVQFGIYGDKGVQPDVKLSTTPATYTVPVGSTTATWFPDGGADITQSLTTDTTYWVMFGAGPTTVGANFCYDSGGVSGQNVNGYMVFSTWVSPFPAHTDSSARRSLYFEYDESGEPPAAAEPALFVPGLDRGIGRGIGRGIR